MLAAEESTMLFDPCRNFQSRWCWVLVLAAEEVGGRRIPREIDGGERKKKRKEVSPRVSFAIWT